MNKVLLDMDGVLVDFVGGACKIHKVQNPYLMRKSHSYDISSVLRIDPVDFWKPLGRDFWANLSPLPWAHDVVEFLESMVGSNNICLLTSPCNTDGCIDGKMDWIKKHLPKYKSKFLIGPSKEFCAHKDSILIDDSADNVSKFMLAGGKSILFAGPWNRKWDVPNEFEDMKSEFSRKFGSEVIG